MPKSSLRPNLMAGAGGLAHLSCTGQSVTHSIYNKPDQDCDVMNEPRPNHLPHLDRQFLDSAAARPIRFLSEYLEPEDRLDRLGVRDTVVFLGSSRLPEPAKAQADLARIRKEGGDTTEAEAMAAMSVYHDHSATLARRLTEWSMGFGDGEHRFVVCTGGGPGVMAAANRGAIEGGGPSMGLNITIPEEQTTNPHVSPDLSFEFRYFFMRKFWFVYMAKAFVILPGGFGTLDEFFEVLTLKQTGRVEGPLPVVLLGERYWREVLNFEAMVRYGTVPRADLDLFLTTDSVDDAFAFLTEQLAGRPLETPGPAMVP
jgi:uncharacterized protein (TIGR00730 family)